MQKRTFGATGVQVPIIGLGTWNMEMDNRDAVVAALRRGIELGATHIDTAEMYGSGEVEELVGQALVGRREQVFLTSKVLPQNATYHGTIRACERSLARLGTDHLDLYLLHWLGSLPLKPTIEALHKLRASGKIKAFGVSNFNLAELQTAVEFAGPGNIVCNQLLYHLEERRIEHEVVPWCRQAGIAVVAYSPFARGSLLHANRRGTEVLSKIAADHQATLRQIALCFLCREEPFFAIPKSSSPKHVEENCRAAEIRLSPEEIERLDYAFPRGEPMQGVATA